MSLIKTTRVLIAIALTTMGFAFPAAATVTTFFSSTPDCLGPSTARFTPGGAAVPMSLCATTTTETSCGITYNLISASAAQDNAFSITTRALGPAITDGTADPFFDVTDPVTGLSVVPQGTTLVRPDGSGVAQPILITNPPTTIDLGGTSNSVSGVAAGTNRLMGTLTIKPQASATLSSYVISLIPNASYGVGGPDCAGSVSTPIAASFTLSLSTAPTITSAAATTFTVATAGTFSVVGTGAPAPTFSASGALPAGVTLSSAGVLAGTPATGTAGTYPVTITASNGTLPNATQAFTLTVAKRTQTITFATIAGQTFAASPFTISATASSGLPVAFTSTTPAVCTVAGTVVTFVTTGTCSITADQAGNADFLAATAVTRTFAIGASVPGAPTIGAATPGNATAAIAFTPPVNNGGAAITSYVASCTPGPITATSTTGALSITVTGLTNGTAYSCSVTARNSVGSSPASAAVSVTPIAPVIPVLTSVVSQKVHGAAGTFELPIDRTQPITGLVTVEPRSIGAGHTIVLRFDAPITSTGTVALVQTPAPGTGVASAVAVGSEIRVTLTGIVDRQRATISLTGINGLSANASVSLGFLVGDVDSSRNGNSSDISRVKARSGQAATALNYMFDVDASGAINSSDVSATKARSGGVVQ